VRAKDLEPFDGRGMLLASLGVAGLAFGLSVAGLDLLPWTIVVALIGGGAIAMTLYVFHARKVKAPPLDFRLTRYPTFHAALIGGFLFRLGIGAMPFLLPLMLQVGFGMTPFQSGMVTFATAVGALGMKTVAARIIGTFGFRPVLVSVGVVSAVFLAATAAFTPGTPLVIIFLILVVGGFFRSLTFTSINTIAYAEVHARELSRATALMAVSQQLSISAGVAVGALVVETTLRWKGATTISAGDFWPAFLVVALISATSAFFFARLPPDAGSEMSGHKAAKAVEPVAAGETSDQKLG
jgi:MFS family permease